MIEGNVFFKVNFCNFQIVEMLPYSIYMNVIKGQRVGVYYPVRNQALSRAYVRQHPPTPRRPTRDVYSSSQSPAQNTVALRSIEPGPLKFEAGTKATGPARAWHAK